MAEYRVIEDFQARNVRIFVLDRRRNYADLANQLYIDGKKYNFTLNAAEQCILLPDVYESFAGKTIEFR